jgi:uncharacterized iron-regulated membrane protein
MSPWWLAFALVAILGVVLWYKRSQRAPGRQSRAAKAAAVRRRLIARVPDEATADRLAEGERKRDPGADMLTCYDRALKRLERDRR